MKTSPLVSLSLLALGCAYTAPENFNSQFDALNTISGTIVAQGVEAPSSAMVLVYDASNPGPPLGTGRPLTFTTVPSSAFTDAGAGIKSAPYALPYLADSDPALKKGDSLDIEHSGYHVTALIDTDVNSNPFAAGLQGATYGDYVGAHLADLETGERGAVTVSGGELKNDVSVVITDHILTQRHAYTTVIAPFMDVQLGADSGANIALAANLRYRLRSTSIHTAYGKNQPLDLDGPCAPAPGMDDTTCAISAACHCDPGTLDPSETAFWVLMKDADEDDAHDPYPPNPDGSPSLQALNGISDTWPRVYIEYLGTPTADDDGNTIFENELGEFEWPPGSGVMRPERWVQENFPMAYELNFNGPNGVAPAGAPVFNEPFPVNELSITYSPVARHYYEGGTYGYDDNGPYDLIDVRCFDNDLGEYPSFATCDGEQHNASEIPKGAWSITVISFTGQTWTVPNEIGLPSMAYALGMLSKPDGSFSGAMESTDPSFNVASQSGYLTTE